MIRKAWIYKITSPTGKVYIGSTISLKKRIQSYKNLRCKQQTRLYNSFVKHGYLNHVIEVVHECTTEDIYVKEFHYGTLYNVLSRAGLNCILPKINDTHQFIRESTLHKMREIKKSQKGHPQTEETKAKLRIAHTGKKLSKEHIEKMRKSKTGKKMSPSALEKCRNRVVTEETRLKLSIAGKGKKRSAEFCERLSRINTGKKHSDETKKKISEVQGVKLVNIITGEFFHSTRSASISLGMGKNYVCQKFKRTGSYYPFTLSQ